MLAFSGCFDLDMLHWLLHPSEPSVETAEPPTRDEVSQELLAAGCCWLLTAAGWPLAAAGCGLLLAAGCWLLLAAGCCW